MYLEFRLQNVGHFVKTSMHNAYNCPRDDSKSMRSSCVAATWSFLCRQCLSMSVGCDVYCDQHTKYADAIWCTITQYHSSIHMCVYMYKTLMNTTQIYYGIIHIHTYIHIVFAYIHTVYLYIQLYTVFDKQQSVSFFKSVTAKREIQSILLLVW